MKAHVGYLKDPHRRKKLMFCDPYEDDSALFLFSVGSKEEAVEIENQDPFIISSVYQLEKIEEIRLVTPENNFLLKK